MEKTLTENTASGTHCLSSLLNNLSRARLVGGREVTGDVVQGDLARRGPFAATQGSRAEPRHPIDDIVLTKWKEKAYSLASAEVILFVFLNKRCDRMKAIWWDIDGLAIFIKRLGSRHLPKTNGKR